MNAVSLIVYPASDVPKATKFFATLLGTEPYADTPYYVGFKTGDMEVGLVPKAAQRGTSGALAYVDVADINGALATLLASGAEKVQDITDVSNGLLVASVTDPDGNAIGLRQFPKS
ncbi:MAG TPA: VOC family protein [Candidatus Cybelea sp.]